MFQKCLTAGTVCFSSPLQQPLQCMLGRALIMNPSTIKQKHNPDLKQKWRSEWRSSRRGKGIAAIDKNTPSVHFLQSVSKANIPCRSASLITHLLTVHIPLNNYLKRVNRMNNARCPTRGAGSETIRHFLLVYPGYYP